jgi:hypothetical protein
VRRALRVDVDELGVDVMNGGVNVGITVIGVTCHFSAKKWYFS